jgi:hypothetical protein
MGSYVIQNYEGTMKYKLDKISFELGMINCFVEMVFCGVKTLAISPPLSPESYDVIGPLSEEIVQGFGIRSYLEKSLLITDLQSEDFTRGKWSILYYEKESVLKDYLELKEKKKRLKEVGEYDETARKTVTREFMRLLSYPENKIEEKLAKTDPSDPFILTET